MNKEYKAEAWYTGGGIYVAVKHIDDRYYVTTDNDEYEEMLNFFDHEVDLEEGYDDEYGFYGIIRTVALDDMTEEERKLYDELKAELDKEMNR